jgi:hypothetical protein
MIQSVESSLSRGHRSYEKERKKEKWGPFQRIVTGRHVGCCCYCSRHHCRCIAVAITAAGIEVAIVDTGVEVATAAAGVIVAITTTAGVEVAIIAAGVEVATTAAGDMVTIATTGVNVVPSPLLGLMSPSLLLVSRLPSLLLVSW